MDTTSHTTPLISPRSVLTWSPRRSKLLPRKEEVSSESSSPRMEEVKKAKRSFYTHPALQLTLAILLLGTMLLLYTLPSFTSTTDDSLLTILISIDGFRAEYLHRNLTPNLLRLAQEGIMAQHLIPSFPTLTFPNHYSIVTGLYPSEHGIISNLFYDPVLNRTFNYTDPVSWHAPFWWGGEPIWVTAERQGKVTAMYQWVGSDVAIGGQLPTHVVEYAPTPLEQRFEQAMRWAQMPKTARSRTQVRPHLIGLYLPDIDHVGHAHGPNSEALDQALVTLDQLLGTFLDSLSHLPKHLVIVSDHGMTAVTRHVRLTPLLGDFANRTFVRYHGPLVLLDPHLVSDRQPLFRHLQSQSKNLFTVYLKENVPEHLHFSDNPRISSIVVIPENGLEFLGDDETSLMGMHGYRMDTSHDMDALFVAHGPQFRSGQVVAAFENIEIYNLLCKLLKITPSKNSGRGLPWIT